MSKERIVYFNGKYVSELEAKISIYDSALMFGDMVFEMTRSFNKKHFSPGIIINFGSTIKTHEVPRTANRH